MMCGRAGALTAQIAALAARIDEAAAPAAVPVAPLDQIPGVGRTGAQEITAESGSAVSSGFGCRPACRARPGGRGSRRRSPCGPRSAATVPKPRWGLGLISGEQRVAAERAAPGPVPEHPPVVPELVEPAQVVVNNPLLHARPDP